MALEALQRRRALPQVHALFEQARLHAGPELREAGVSGDGAQHLQELLSASSRPGASCGPSRPFSPPTAWGSPASGRTGSPATVRSSSVHASRPEDLQLLRELLAAHAYWRRRSVSIDLVILDDGANVYEQPLRASLERRSRGAAAPSGATNQEAIFVVRGGLLPPESLTLLEAVAGAVLDAEHGGLGGRSSPGCAEARRTGAPAIPSCRSPSTPFLPEPTPPLERPADLLFDLSDQLEKGFGGFTPDGREYVIHLEPGRATPAPWVNVVANPHFGFLASESGGGYTWAENSSERRLTPWRNDPVQTRRASRSYLRDEETGEV